MQMTPEIKKMSDMKSECNKVWNKRRICYAWVCASFVIYYMLILGHYYLMWSLSDSVFYLFGIPVLFGAYFAARGLRDGREVQLLLFWWIWLIVTRALNGDKLLTENVVYITAMSLVILTFLPGILLSAKEQANLFSAVAFIVVVFFLILGAACIYVGIHHVIVTNPLDGFQIYLRGDRSHRLSLMNQGFNVTGGLFLIPFCASFYLLFKSRNPFVRILATVSILTDWICIALTFARSAETCLCLFIGLVISLAIEKKLRGRGMLIVIPVMLLTTIAVTVVAYQTFHPIRSGIYALYVRQSETELEETAEPDESNFVSDNREYFKSSRTELYWSALKSLELEPERLLIGSSETHVMDVSHSLIAEKALNFHNIFLQTVNQFGIPGLLLVCWFLLLILRSGWRICIEKAGNYPIANKIQVLTVVVLLGHNMLDCDVFYQIDFRSLFFFLVCGMITGTSLQKGYT